MTLGNKQILISGAGIVGLLAAQALKARGVDFVIFDRDRDVHFREDAGWAITLHWALDTFLSLLPENLASEIYEAQVRKDFHLCDTGTFRYINASDGSTILSIPPSQRLRVRREQIRRILLKGIDVHWNCKLTRVAHLKCGRVVAQCESGREFQGDVLLGCDGANSQIRRLFCGDAGRLEVLPVRFCGAKVKISRAEEAHLARQFDPLLFQGTVPENETFFWFSMLSTPDYTLEEDGYFAQVNLSWKIRGQSDEPFGSATEKADAMLAHARGLHPQLHQLVARAAKSPENLVEIKLADWPEVRWDTHQGSVVLLGDVAHAMTMYRGEAANHGIADVADFIGQTDRYLKGDIPWADAVSNYCEQVYLRAQEAVLLSRQACLDAHDMSKITAGSASPLLTKRKIS
ncbi:FAD/NAD(P)-binding domain-containing protein [Metschnikowia bicuspidata var. bicuspidata NRRL YB-4993]|uniref:FAD/NAD(P)-binding domain-containing protein n=1 Tax=Metschnikowia bicuspidata var. bicuspidata NRRL YB-4993 TaxID=869754 RepID=A0A1A0HE44_9ASCO|nr:FAD/NAD(P)-binding domain-containing protein [Metschnikowia bicuspidata var. bicuspidata NRRL YB-4993]OBA22379.1 FAD/NAD(P)-binding domain-containing protein [Metschnikowia bicuspidata var. bicuspidata NRRL YB-4993]